MTQKELLYFEDGISHERILVSNLIDIMNCLNDEDLKEYIKKEITKHQKLEKELINLLEDNTNE